MTRKELVIILSILAALFVLTVATALSSNWQGESEVRDLCADLGAEFRESPSWMCVRGDEIVYGGNK